MGRKILDIMNVSNALIFNQACSCSQDLQGKVETLNLFLSKSITMMLAKLLICSMFLTNPACIVAAQAAITAEKTVDSQEAVADFTVDKSAVEPKDTTVDSENHEKLTA